MAALLDVSDLHKRLRQSAGASGRVVPGGRGRNLRPARAERGRQDNPPFHPVVPERADLRRRPPARQAVRPGDSDLRRLIGIVPQELAVYEQLTARENLLFFGELYGLGGRPLAARATSCCVPSA